jgi:hypothetical protein
MRHSYYVVLLSLAACTTPTWITYPVDQYLTVHLPAKPKVTNLDGMGVNKLLKQKTLPFQAFLAEDQNGVYAIVVDASARVEHIPADADRDSLYAQGIKQILARANDNRLLSRTRFNTPAGEGIELVVRTSSPETHTPLLVYNRTLFTTVLYLRITAFIRSPLPLTRRYLIVRPTPPSVAVSSTLSR